MATATYTTISNYIEPDYLALLIRTYGGSAWVETVDGCEIVKTNRSLAWVRQTCRQWNRHMVTP